MAQSIDGRWCDLIWMFPELEDDVEYATSVLKIVDQVATSPRHPVRLRYWPDGCPKRFDTETGEVGGTGSPRPKPLCPALPGHPKRLLCNDEACWERGECSRLGVRLDNTLHK